MKATPLQFPAHGFPVALGLLFLFAAAQRLLHPGPATMALESIDVPTGWARALVTMAIITEIYLGTLLVLRRDLRYALAASSALLLAFTGYLWFLTTLANPPSCGCLGLTGIFSNSRAEALLGLSRNVLLLWLIHWSQRRLFPSIADVKVHGGTDSKPMMAA
jgi:hypothetical protein